MERRRDKYTSLDEDVMNQSILHIEDIEGITTDIDDKPVSATVGVAPHQGSRLPKMTKYELPSIDKLTGEETDSPN
ncbi:hypothetical protein N7499_004459 [Penicillium canescens]|uniref:Uncharacterized protein n=1 Tax=Penicillium canescens TaxID=5083 RepID=A0AAD6N7K0_PENCN|nr:uncharacterized protein N7446_005188 [Penicillium canescens]KAJ6038388.1 hypothetical protein N7460_008159 [Penicillium canescens]KAJ6039495.1 hypothetical protein N7444_008400 [Penicillium canescens]KAJ6068151.1 hypothetical protein N7446_005188 [Penicillium canescens]KAJ6084830.1 hypothetical protein N7499_004459 [Penicillium canescens]KAJ6161615.1 hypothetical protein N7485_009845 [Penicillium canescens]